MRFRFRSCGPWLAKRRPTSLSPSPGPRQSRCAALRKRPSLSAAGSWSREPGRLPARGGAWSSGRTGPRHFAAVIDERPVSFDLKLECDPEEVGLLSEALGATVERGGRPGRGPRRERCAGRKCHRHQVEHRPAGARRGGNLLARASRSGRSGDMSALEPSRQDGSPGAACLHGRTRQTRQCR